MGGGSNGVNCKVKGIVYPFAKEGRGGTADDRCTEQAEMDFCIEELDWLTSNLVGVPVCLDHELGQRVGTVTAARRTPSNGVVVKCLVEGSTDLGRKAVGMCMSHEIQGLSLGHSFSHATPYNSGMQYLGDGPKIVADVRNRRVIRELREVTLTPEPARNSCYVLKIVKASAATGEGSINTPQGPTVHEEWFATTDGHLLASNMEATQQQPTSNAEQAPDQAASTAGAVATESAGSTDAVATEQEQARELARDEQGRFAQEPGEILMDAQSAELIAKATLRLQDYEKRINDYEERLRASDAERIEKEEARLQAEQRLEEMQKQSDQKQKAERARREKEAKEMRDSKAAELMQLLEGSGVKMPAQAAGATDKESKLRQEADMMQAVINKAKEMGDTQKAMQGHGQALKRTHEQLARSNQNFGTVNASAALEVENGIVNASGNGNYGQQTKKQNGVNAIMCKYYSDNKHNIGGWDLDRYHKRLVAETQSCAFGTVNASAATETRRADETTDYLASLGFDLLGQTCAVYKNMETNPRLPTMQDYAAQKAKLFANESQYMAMRQQFIDQARA